MDRENDRFLPTPAQLMEDPELAVLRILQATLEVAEVALKASYPCDAEAVYCKGGRTEPEVYATVILHQIEVLGVLLQEYVESVRRLRQWRYRERNEEDTPS